jgi:hypothetical protein
MLKTAVLPDYHHIMAVPTTALFFQKHVFAFSGLAAGLMRMPGIWRVESRIADVCKAFDIFFGGVSGGVTCLMHEAFMFSHRKSRLRRDFQSCDGLCLLGVVSASTTHPHTANVSNFTVTAKCLLPSVVSIVF